MEEFKQYREVAGDVTFAVKQGYVNNYVLTANSNKAITAPAGAKYALFSADADIWVLMGGVASIPSGDVSDGSGSELNPIARRVESGQTIGIISDYAAKVSVVFYE